MKVAKLMGPCQDKELMDETREPSWMRGSPNDTENEVVLSGRDSMVCSLPAYLFVPGCICFRSSYLLNDFEVALLITACSFLNDDSPALCGTSFHPAAF